MRTLASIVAPGPHGVRPAPQVRLLAVALVAAMGLACAQGPDAGSRPAQTTLAVGVGQPVDGRSPDGGVARIAEILRSAWLVSMGRDGHAQPALAERWSASPDGRTWRFVLRPGLTFHDGSTLDAAAVAAALTPPEGGQVVPGLRDVLSVAAAGPREVVVTLREPSSLLLEALYVAAVYGGHAGLHGAGPFRAESEEPGLTVLKAFPGFWRGRPAIDRVELRSYKTQRTAWSALMRGEIDFLHEVVPEAVGFVEGSRDVQVFSYLRPFVFLLGFNLHHPALARREVRRALTVAVDRERVIEHALSGNGVVATGPVWPLYWAHDWTVQPPRYDPARAGAALDAAGFPLRPSTQAARPPSRFEFTCLVPEGHPLFERLAIVIQQQLADVGVDMHIELVPLPALGGRLASGEFDAFLFQMSSGQGMNWPYWFWHSRQDGPRFLTTGYSGADAALDRVRRAIGDEEERAAIHAFQETIRDDPPALFLCWGQTSRAVRRTFVVPEDPDRDILATIAQWRVAGFPARRASP